MPWLVGCGDEAPASDGDGWDNGDDDWASAARTGSRDAGADTNTGADTATTIAPTGGDPDAEAAPSGDAAAASTPDTYKGMILATGKVTFGGGTYCDYNVYMKDVAIEVTAPLSSPKDVTAAKVQDVVVEATLGTCPYPASPQRNQDFTLKAATPTTTGVHLTFTGAATNKPTTTLVMDLVSQGGGTSYAATMTWTRTDQSAASLNWKVTGKTTLEKQ